MSNPRRRVLVAGASSFVGKAIASGLLAEGAEVTLLVQRGTEDKVATYAQYARIVVADIWDVASLRGRARGHHVAIHAVGSLTEDTRIGMSFHRMNVVSARNIANLCISDGVGQLVLLSAVNSLIFHPAYIRAKREAEQYVMRLGLPHHIIRAPLLYPREEGLPFFYGMMSALGNRLPLRWTRLGVIAPLPVDILARGVARVALEPTRKIILNAHDLRRLNTPDERRGTLPTMRHFMGEPDGSGLPFEAMADGDVPFGWLP